MSDEIVRITEQKHIASILGLHDERLEKQVLHMRNISKADWVQFLSSMITKPNLIAIWGVLENDKIKHYLVALNAVMPPLAKEVFFLYQNFFGNKDSKGQPYHFQMLELVKQWGLEIGAESLCLTTAYPKVMSRFGFEKADDLTTMKLDIKGNL